MKQAIEYIGCIVLWIAGTILTIVKKKPYLTAGIAGLHAVEAATIGIKTGLKFGKKLPYCIAMCMAFGFTWWLPLKKQIEAETFTDEDFIRRSDDCIVANREG